MFKKIIFIAVAFMLYFGLSAAYGVEAPKAQAPSKEMTKENMLAELKADLADNDELFDVIPGLSAGAGQKGSAVYTYKGIALDELSKEDMAKLFGTVRQALTKIRTDRIQRQLETIRQIEKLQKAPAPPQPPRVPTTPPSAPRTPPLPPSGSQRR